jgi:hypothetical protein
MIDLVASDIVERAALRQIFWPPSRQAAKVREEDRSILVARLLPSAWRWSTRPFVGLRRAGSK